MADLKHALVLHLSGASEPVVFALSEKGARDLESKLVQLLSEGLVHAPDLADGSTVAVNFANVVTAHLDTVQPNARIYGNSQPRMHGFASQ